MTDLKSQRVDAIRRDFRKRFCIPGTDTLEDLATVQMIEDWWLIKLGLLNRN